MDAVLGLILALTALLCSAILWVAGKRAGVAEQEALYKSAGKLAAELVEEAEKIAASTRDEAFAAGLDIRRKAELESAEIRARAELEVAAFSASTLQQLETECSAIRADLDAKRRELQLLHVQAAERLAEAEHLKRDHQSRLERLENRSPTRPLGGFSIQQLAEGVAHNWHSPNKLSELAFELQTRTGVRAGELLAEASDRLATLGVLVPFQFHLRQDDPQSAARLAALQQEVHSLRKQVRTGAHRTERLAALKAEVESLRMQVAQWKTWYRDAISIEDDPSATWESKYRMAIADADSLRAEIEMLQGELESLKSASVDRSPLRSFFVTQDATIDFIEHAKRYWQKRLHPDMNKDDPNATAHFQKMGNVFDAILNSRLGRKARNGSG